MPCKEAIDLAMMNKNANPSKALDSMGRYGQFQDLRGARVMKVHRSFDQKGQH